MNKIIGITGLMGSGKSTLSAKLKKLLNNNITVIDVDLFRRKLIKDKSFIDILKREIKELKDIKYLNKLIYNNQKCMVIFKKELYKNLKNYISKIKGLVLIDWALIIDDGLTNWFDKIILVKCSKKIILQRLSNGDLSSLDVKKRLCLQFSFKEKLNILKKRNINYLIVKNEDKCNLDIILNFIKAGD